MKTTVIDNNKVNGKFSCTAGNNKTEHPKVIGLPISKEFNSREEEPKKMETAQTGEPPKPATPKAQPEQKGHSTKSEIKEQLKEEKPALNLESTLKLVEALHRRKIQRDKLLGTISTLEAFEVARIDDAEETNGNPFQSCELTIWDNKNRQFTTKNFFIINAVAKYVNKLCVDRLTEIEGEIYIPS